MERIGILEMAADHETSVKGLQVPSYLAQQDKFITILMNDFQMIPEGFTGVYMRDEECQIVPNELVQQIKELSIGGFDYAPEDHELHLFVNRWTPEGTWLNQRIIELVGLWMDSNL